VQQSHFAWERAIAIIQRHPGNIKKTSQLTKYLEKRGDQKLSKNAYDYIQAVMELRKPIHHPPATDREVAKAIEK
jgi:hypothetical protein